jgi:probable rRNA maturation factor
MPVDLVCDENLERLAPLDSADPGRWQNVVAERTGDERAHWDICVRLCSEAVSSALNQQYRGKASATNVLSFTAEVSLPDTQVLGDLAVCWPVVLREAEQQGKDPLDHFTHLCVHGFLHLLGFDHESAIEAAAMEALEVRILHDLQIADPYVPGPDEGSR